MRRFLGIVSALPALFVAGTAAAEEAAKPVPAPDLPPASTVCIIGAHSAELNESARTATTLVCDALRARGVAVGPAVEDGAGTMRATSVRDLSEL